MKVVAVMLVRNEEACLPRCLERLAEQGLYAAMVDNGSSDRSLEIAASFGSRVLHIEHVPFAGTFAMGPLLQAAARMQAGIDADWFILNSPDEVFDSDRPGETLVEAIARADAAGHTAINFDEFVFVPERDNVSYVGRPFDREMRTYYHFAPAPLRQMRAWKNIPGITNIDDAGHRLCGDVRLYPANMPFRHHLCLSIENFRAKYEGRMFPADELAKGWHHNRANIDTARVRLPPVSTLKVWNGDITTLDRSDPKKKHFWEPGWV